MKRAQRILQASRGKTRKIAKIRAVETFGERLRRLREERKLTQEALAKKAGIKRLQVFKLEKAKSKDTKLETAKQLAVALDVSLEELAGVDAPQDQVDAVERYLTSDMARGSQLSLDEIAWLRSLPGSPLARRMDWSPDALQRLVYWDRDTRRR